MKKVEHLSNKFLPKVNDLPEMLNRFKDASVFSNKETDSLQCSEEPLIYGDVKIDNDEREALLLDPKFAVYDALEEENFEVETEKAFTKMRWHNYYNKDETENEEEKITLTVEERERLDILDAKTRQVFDPESKTFDLRKLRATDVKLNSQVYLPESQNVKC